MSKISFVQTIQREEIYSIEVTDLIAERMFHELALSDYVNQGTLVPRFTANDIVEIAKLNFSFNQERIVTPEMLQNMKLSKPWARLTFEEARDIIEGIYDMFCIHIVDNYNPREGEYEEIVDERIEIKEIE